MYVDAHAHVHVHGAWRMAHFRYLNGCKCGERVEKRMNYEGDIEDLHDFGFDGVKIDGWYYNNK